MAEEQLQPITFTITDQENLRKITEFQEEHLRTCGKRYTDFTGAMFRYTFIHRGLAQYIQ